MAPLLRYGPYLWLVLILGCTVFFAVSQQDEVARIRDTIGGAQPEWIVALVGLEACILILIAGTYRSLLSKLGHTIRLDTLVGVHLKRVAVGAVTPVSGPSSVLVFVHALRKRGVGPADALLAVSIRSVIGNVAFLSLLLPVLFLQEPTRLLIAGTAGMAGIVAVTVTLLGFALRSAKPPHWLLARLPRKGLKLLAQVRRHDLSIPALGGPFACVMATRLAGVLMLYFALQAVGQHTSPGVPLIAYAVGLVALLAAPVFQGIGIVEVSMAVALQKLGVPPAAAIGAALLCRAGELWLPLMAGILYQAFETLSRRPAPQPVPAPVMTMRSVHLDTPHG